MQKRYNAEFLQLWRKQYNKIHWLGRIINQSKHEQASENHLAKLERKFDLLIKEHRQFMDSNDAKLPKPLYRYDIYDKSTWASSIDFEHSDKVSFYA